MSTNAFSVRSPLVVFVIVFHLVVFVVETFLWMQPGIYEFALGRLDAPVAVGLHDQALILESLFVNQGFYNLFLAIAGIVGLVAIRGGDARVGAALIAMMCLSALGAGIVLAFSTGAIIGALLQAGPAAVVSWSVCRGLLATRPLAS